MSKETWAEEIRLVARIRPTEENEAMNYAHKAIDSVQEAIQEAVQEERRRIEKEVMQKVNSAGGLGGWKHLEDILDEVINKDK